MKILIFGENNYVTQEKKWILFFICSLGNKNFIFLFRVFDLHFSSVKLLKYCWGETDHFQPNTSKNKTYAVQPTHYNLSKIISKTVFFAAFSDITKVAISSTFEWLFPLAASVNIYIRFLKFLTFLTQVQIYSDKV